MLKLKNVLEIVFGTNFGGFDTPEAIHPDAVALSVNAKKLLRLL